MTTVEISEGEFCVIDGRSVQIFVIDQILVLGQLISATW